MGHERSLGSSSLSDDSVTASAAAATIPTTSRTVPVELFNPSRRFMDAVSWPPIVRSGLPARASLTSIPGICTRCAALAALARS